PAGPDFRRSGTPRYFVTSLMNVPRGESRPNGTVSHKPHTGSMIRRTVVSIAAVIVTAGALRAQTLDSASIAGLRWRTVGNANYMGRMSDVVGIPGPSKTLFVAAAAGGIWKSTNNGQTWRPVFDDKRVVSMGMLAIAPSDTMQVWAGTGEPNSRNTIE